MTDHLDTRPARGRRRAVALLAAFLAWSAPSAAQTVLGAPDAPAAPDSETERASVSACYAVAEAPGSLVRRADFVPDKLADREVALVYVGHSTFLIETQSGVTVATDYSGYSGPGVTPEVVTMNQAHETHYTLTPDPRIAHVLHGWNPEGGPARHDLTIGELRIRNVTTDIRGWGEAGVDGNSIFVFEVGDLCIGHLGHLHHKPTPEQFAEIGFLDVVLAPVDGVYTMRQSEMIATLKRLRAKVVVPMHAFGPATMAAFLAGMSDVFEVDVRDDYAVVLSKERLPARSTVLALRPYYPGEDD